VKSLVRPSFWRAYIQLAESTKKDARKAYALFAKDPAHPSLRFKKSAGYTDVWSVRISAQYRAVGQRDEDAITWVWIGRADADAQMFGHHRAHPRQAPQSVVVAVRLRSLGQQRGQPLPVRVLEHRRRARLAFALEGSLPAQALHTSRKSNHLPDSSRKIRATSRTPAGCACMSWPDGTIFSLSAPGKCALR
jgi:hypothetical protein